MGIFPKKGIFISSAIRFPPSLRNMSVISPQQGHKKPLPLLRKDEVIECQYLRFSTIPTTGIFIFLQKSSSFLIVSKDTMMLLEKSIWMMCTRTLLWRGHNDPSVWIRVTQRINYREVLIRCPRRSVDDCIDEQSD